MLTRLILFTLLVSVISSSLRAKSKVLYPVGSTDTIVPVSFRQEDTPVNEYLLQELDSVRQNFFRINSKTEWSRTDTVALWDSTEGGEAVFYYEGEIVEKIIAWRYFEMGQHLTEYYLLDNELSFVLEKEISYNRPIYRDAAKATTNGNDEVFDAKVSEVVETSSYFKDGTLLHQINSLDCGAPFSGDYLWEEEERLEKEFGKLYRN